MANQLLATLPPGSAIQARRLARLTRDRFHLEQDTGREAAFCREVQCCDVLQAANPPNMNAMSSTPPQQTISGRKTASTARPVSVSWARANPMQLQTSAQTPAISPPHTGIICKGPVEPRAKAMTRKAV